MSGDYFDGSYAGTYVITVPSFTSGSAAYTGGAIDTVANGTLAALGAIDNTYGIGLVLAAGDTLTNGSAGDTTALITGSTVGVQDNYAATVTNFGTINGGSTGIYLASGIVTNRGAASLIEGGNYGVNLAGAGTVINEGTISTAGNAAVQFGSSSDVLIDEGGAVFYGAVVGGGGTLLLAGDNGAGTISGLNSQFFSFSQIEVEAGAHWTLAGTYNDPVGSLTNDGSLTVVGDLSATALDDFVSNAGTLDNLGSVEVVGMFINTGTIDNAGTLSVEHMPSNYAGTFFLGTFINQGTVYGSGTVVSGGIFIDQGVLSGVLIDQVNGTVDLTHAESNVTINVDYGRLELHQSQNYAGVFLQDFGIGATIDLTDTAYAVGETATYHNGHLYVLNAGATAASMAATIGNAPHDVFTVTNDGSGHAAIAVSSTYLDTSSGGVHVSSDHFTVGPAGNIQATGDGIYSTVSGLTLRNEGTVDGSSNGVNVRASTTITNATGAVITGDGLGVELYGGGLLVNEAGATISGGDIGVDAFSGTVDNSGTIESAEYLAPGLSLRAGVLINRAGGLIEGSLGAEIGGSQAATAINYGTMDGFSGFSGLHLFGSNDVLRIEAGSTIVGNAYGHGGTLELGAEAGSGTFSGIGSHYYDFSRYQVNAAADWTLAGSNALAGNATLADLGTLTVASGATLQDSGIVTLASGASLSNLGLIKVDGGMLVDDGVLTGGTIDVASNGTVDFAAAVSGVTVDFDDGSTLKLDQGAGNYGGVVIADFASTDTIDLTGVNYSGLDRVTYNSSLQEIIVYGPADATLAALDVTGFNPGTGALALQQDGSGTDIVVCFAAGTRILTDLGEVAVEDLAPGDLVVTLSGTGPVLKPVTWLGRRRIDPARHKRPSEVHPVRICAGAFAENVPHRDLLVSPGHALYVDGVLIPASQLVNGVMVRQERGQGVVEYWHVELDSHDVLLAEGMPAESYLDSGNRRFFDGGDAVALHGVPDGDRGVMAYCAPWHEVGSAVAAVKRRLIERVTVLGYALGGDADLRLEADGGVLRPIAVEGAVRRFVVPACVDELRLISASAVPAETGADNFDTRRLGVAVSRVVEIADGVSREIALDGTSLSQGWHALEREGARSWRWTDGDAVIAARVGILEITVYMTVARWCYADADRSRERSRWKV